MYARLYHTLFLLSGGCAVLAALGLLNLLPGLDVREPANFIPGLLLNLLAAALNYSSWKSAT